MRSAVLYYVYVIGAIIRGNIIVDSRVRRYIGALMEKIDCREDGDCDMAYREVGDYFVDI